MWDCHLTLPFRSLPGSTQLDCFAIARLTHKIYLEHVGWRRLGTRQKKTRQKKRWKGHLCTDSVCGGFVGVLSGRLGSRQKKKLKLHRRSIIRASLPLHMLFNRHLDEVTWKAHSQVTITRTMEHRRQSNKKALRPSRSFTSLNERNPASLNWMATARPKVV